MESVLEFAHDLYARVCRCLFVMYLTYSMADDKGPQRAKLVTNPTYYYCSVEMDLSTCSRSRRTNFIAMQFQHYCNSLDKS